MASFTAELQNSPWYRRTPRGYEPYKSDAVIGNTPTGSKQVGGGATQET